MGFFGSGKKKKGEDSSPSASSPSPQRDIGPPDGSPAIMAKMPSNNNPRTSGTLAVDDRAQRRNAPSRQASKDSKQGSETFGKRLSNQFSQGDAIQIQSMTSTDKLMKASRSVVMAERMKKNEEGVFGPAREFNTILMGGEDSPFQDTYTVELDRSDYVTYFGEPKCFRAPPISEEDGLAIIESSDEEDDEELFPYRRRYLDPRDALLRQPHEPPSKKTTLAMNIEAVMSTGKKESETGRVKKRKHPRTGWKTTKQRATFAPDAFLESTGKYHLGIEDGRYLKVLEDWGIEYEMARFPLCVTNIHYGTVADEFGAAHPEKIIQKGDILVEVNDTPIYPNANVYHQQRRLRLTPEQIEDEDELHRIQEVHQRIKDDLDKRPARLASEPGLPASHMIPQKKVKAIPDPFSAQHDDTSDSEDQTPKQEPVHQPRFGGQSTVRAGAASKQELEQHEAAVRALKASGRRASITGYHAALFGYNVSSVTRLGVKSSRLGFKHEDLGHMKHIDCYDQLITYKRMDVINKELFDDYYHGKKVKLRFVRLKPPQIDTGNGYGFTLNLQRAQVRVGQRVPWGLEFHLDWEQLGPRSNKKGAGQSGKAGKGKNKSKTLALKDKDDSSEDGSLDDDVSMEDAGEERDLGNTASSAWQVAHSPMGLYTSQDISDISDELVAEGDASLRRVIKVASVKNGSVAKRWNEEDPDMSILPGDKVTAINGIDVSTISWKFLSLPCYPEDAENIHTKKGKRLEDAHEKIKTWKNQIIEKFQEHKLLSQLFELTIVTNIDDNYEKTAAQEDREDEETNYDFESPINRVLSKQKRNFYTFLKCKENYFQRDLELEVQLYRYDPDALFRKSNLVYKSAARVLEPLEDMEGSPLHRTQSIESPMHQPPEPGSAEEIKSKLLDGIVDYEPPPALELPQSLARSRFKTYLTRSDVSFPWGIYLDERFANLGIYVVQELEEAAEAPVNKWNEYVSNIGAYGCQIQVGDIITAFNEKSDWEESETEIGESLKLVCECYRPPYKPCAMVSPPFLQTNEKVMDVRWSRSRFLTTIYDDEEALANTPDGGMKDTHYCIVLHSISPDRWYLVDGLSREARDITSVCTAIPAPILSLSITNLQSLRTYEAYVAIRNSQGWSAFSKVSNRETLQKFIQLKINTKKMERYGSQERFVCTADERVPIFSDKNTSATYGQMINPGEIVLATRQGGGWIKMEKATGGRVWVRYAQEDHFTTEKQLYHDSKLLCMAPTSFEILEGRFPCDAPQSIKPQPLPISLEALDKQLTKEHFSTLEQWKAFYRKREEEKIEAAKQKRVAELIGTLDLEAEQEKTHRKASLDFFRVSEVVPKLEENLSGSPRQMFKKRLETHPHDQNIKSDNVTTYKAVLSRKIPNEIWGLKFDTVLERAGQLVVRNVIIDYKIPNVITRWNRMQLEKKTLHLEVRIGDRLIKCNGKSTSHAILREMEVQRELRCEFCRTGDAKRPLPDAYLLAQEALRLGLPPPTAGVTGAGALTGGGGKLLTNEENDMLAGQDRSANLFNSETLREPVKVEFHDFQPLGFAIDWRSGWPLKVKYVAKHSAAMKLGVEEDDVIFAINGHEVQKRHFDAGEEALRKQIEAGLAGRPLEIVFHRAMRFTIAKAYPARAKEVKKLVLPEGCILGFTFDVDQMPPPVRHVKPFSKAMRSGIHIADALCFVNGQKVAEYMLESHAALAGHGHTILDQMLAERPLELQFERGHYELPYPDNFIISESGFAYDPTLVMNIPLSNVDPGIPRTFKWEYNMERDVLPRIVDVHEANKRKGLKHGDLLLAVNGRNFYDFDDSERDVAKAIYSADRVVLSVLLQEPFRKYHIAATRIQARLRGVRSRRHTATRKSAKDIQRKYMQMNMAKLKNACKTEEEKREIAEKAAILLQRSFRKVQEERRLRQDDRARNLEKAILLAEAGTQGIRVDVDPNDGELIDTGLALAGLAQQQKAQADIAPIDKPQIPDDEGFSSSDEGGEISPSHKEKAKARPEKPSAHLRALRDMFSEGVEDIEREIRELQQGIGGRMAAFAVRAKRKPGQKWGIAFDVDRAIVINVFEQSVFGEWRSSNKVQIGDVIYSVNDDTDPRGFYDKLINSNEVEIEFRRLLLDTGQGPRHVRGPFEAEIKRRMKEKWGFVMDTTTGTVFDVIKDTPADQYNRDCAEAGKLDQMLQVGDKIVAINRVPLSSGLSAGEIFEGRMVKCFIMPKGFEELLPSRKMEL